MRNDSPGNISVNCRVVFLPIGNIFLLVSTMTIEGHEVVVKEEHVYIDARTFFQNWINGPDRKYFHEHAGRDMAFEKARGIEIGFGRRYEVDRLVILSPIPSSVGNVEEDDEE
jgi:hypothetical protein